MSRRLRRPVLASLLMAATAAVAALPPSHIHLAADAHDHDRDHDHDDDHHYAPAVEHSHWAPHDHLAASEIEEGDDEGPALFVDHPARVSAPEVHLTRPPAALIALFVLPIETAVTVKAHRDSGNAPRDGPPRGLTRLRAPPASPAL